MDIHKNAATTPRGRYEIVRRAASGESRAGIARALGVSAKTVAKWLERYAAEGSAGLRDRRSRPHRLHRPTPPATADRALALRRQRRTLAEIARKVGVSKSTAARLCRRAGLARLKVLDPVLGDLEGGISLQIATEFLPLLSPDPGTLALDGRAGARDLRIARAMTVAANTHHAPMPRAIAEAGLAYLRCVSKLSADPMQPQVAGWYLAGVVRASSAGNRSAESGELPRVPAAQ